MLGSAEILVRACLTQVFFFTSSLGLEPARARWAQRMGRDPPPVLPGRLAAEEAPAEEAAEVWVRWAVLRLALLLMVLPLLLPRRRRPWVLRLWQRVLWRLLLGLLLGLLLWLLQAVVRRPKEDRGNVAAGDLGEGWQFYLVALLQPLGGLLWLLLLPWLLLRLLLRLVLRLLLLLWLALALRLVPWLWLLVLQLLLLWLLLSRGRWPWPLLPVGSGGEGVWRLGLGDWLALQLLLLLL